MSASRANKRAIDPPEEKAPAKRQRLKEGATEEDRMADAAQDSNALQNKQQKERKYWDQYDTALLAAWLVDYEQRPETFDQLVINRELCLDTLCSEDWVYRPEGSAPKQLLLMQQIWCKRRGDSDGDEPMILPGRVQKPSASATVTPKKPAAASSSAGSQPQPPEGEPASPSANLGRRFASAAGHASDGRGIDPPPQSFSLVDATGNPHPGTSSPVVYAACRTCCTLRQSDRTEWVCSCGLRGDLATDHPANVHLASIRIMMLKKEAAVTTINLPLLEMQAKPSMVERNGLR